MSRASGPLVFLLGCTVLAWQQEPLPEFRAGIDLLQIDATVLDRQRRPVRNLTAGDFVVEIDGRPSPIRAFTPMELPAPEARRAPAAAWLRDVAPDVTSNAWADRGRVMVILIDYQLAMPMTVTVRRIAHALVDAMGPDDVAAVVYLWQARPQNFTYARARLNAAIDQPYLPFTDVPPAFCWCNVCRLDSMTTVADALRDVPQRRKDLFYLGARIGFQGSGECQAALKDARTRLFRALDRADVTVHSLDPAGLRTMQAGAEFRTPGRVGFSSSPDLRTLPERTGGRTVTDYNDPDQVVPAIMAEDAFYYGLGVERPTPRPDGRDRTVRVLVQRPGLTVSSRRLLAARDGVESRAAKAGPAGAPLSLLDAVSPVWPSRAIGLATATAAFAENAVNQQATVVVVTDVRQRSTGVSPAADRSISVLTGSWDRNGAPIAMYSQTIRAQPGGERENDVALDRYQIASRLALPNGAHELRVAVEDMATHARGSVYTYVDVPDFAKERLSLSGLVAGARPSPALGPADLFNDLLPIVPTALREFTNASRVAAFVRAYQGGDDTLHDVTMMATLVGASNTPLVEERTTLSASRFAAANRSADYMIEVPVAKLEPGPYLLTLLATLGDKHVERHMRFEMK